MTIGCWWQQIQCLVAIGCLVIVVTFECLVAMVAIDCLVATDIECWWQLIECWWQLIECLLATDRVPGGNRVLGISRVLGDCDDT